VEQPSIQSLSAPKGEFFERSTSSVSAIEPSPKPGTSEGEIRPPKFSSQFEDDPYRSHRNTSNLFNAQLGEESFSIHTDQYRNPLIEPSLRPTVLPYPPNKANLKEAIKEEWSNGVGCFSKAIWISSPSMINPCSIRGTTIKACRCLTPSWRSISCHGT
jgi:hypothetical protein